MINDERTGTENEIQPENEPTVTAEQEVGFSAETQAVEETAEPQPENEPIVTAEQEVGFSTKAQAVEETAVTAEQKPADNGFSPENAVEQPVPTTEEPVYAEQMPPAGQYVPPQPQMPPQGAYYVPQGMPVQGWYPQGQPYAPPPYPPYGYAQPAQQPYYQPMPQAQPPMYCPPPYAYPMPPAAPKKKMSAGLKVFIWVASILVGIAILGFTAYLAISVNTNSNKNVYNNFPYNYYNMPRADDYNGGNQEDEVPDYDDGVETPEVDEEEPVQPDVDVTPNNDGITIKGKPNGAALSAQEVYDKVVKSTVTVAVTLKKNGAEQTSTGTGIIATADGYIITNSHVVLNSKSSVVEITTYDGEKYEAVVVGMDRSTDLAVLKTNDHNFTPAEFGDSSLLVIGESVVAIGNPGGEKFSGSMTGGYVSGLDREVGRYSASGMTYIQTDAAINPGNSGGPLVNMYGQVVGINSSKIITDGYEGMGFAIPVSQAKEVIDVLLAGGYVEGRTRLGITGTEISEAQSAIYGYPRGFMIAAIDDESAFTGTNAKVGDIITAIDGEVVTSLSDISNLLTRYSPGDQVEITLNRSGKEITVTATLLADKGETQK